ncbi:UbiA family prenyltransferase [Dyadobacter fermentans]|uniref:UbiA family prenyltransferase n=1 Tax=Dyadobacter fermentans TaxID=94254 RepID=UPI001CBEE178|nr:UbiA family prenyltransferase [Dyadobacter fermentans]MBZ1359747.1 UbiA family prenyltransferase [Dyadobacter fermentans]
MLNRIIAFVFFANYFVGILAVALSLETAFQLNIPLNSPAYYILLFCTTVFYYTMAYSGPVIPKVSANPRTEWYRQHYRFVRVSQVFLFSICAFLGAWYLVENFHAITHLPLYYWLVLSVVPLAAILYYGLLPKSIISFNLRHTGWLKAFVIGFVWAGCVNLFPVTALRIERGITVAEPLLMLWLFTKNWMFCTVNAIMFDMKDYEDDANIELKTFAVRMGLRKTIYVVLVPLLLVGLISFLAFAIYQHFGIPTILFNMVPFVCLLAVAFSLQKRQSILFYLIVIDGLLLVKALCGIAGSFFAHQNLH